MRGVDVRDYAGALAPAIRVELPSACSGSMVWATKVTYCLMTVSSMEVPNPSLRISTEQFGRSGRAIFVGAGDDDVEGKDLIGEPGKSRKRAVFWAGAPRRHYPSLDRALPT